MFLLGDFIVLVFVKVPLDVVVVLLVGYHAGYALEVGNLQGVGLLLLVLEVGAEILVDWGLMLLLVLAQLLFRL